MMVPVLGARRAMDILWGLLGGGGYRADRPLGYKNCQPDRRYPGLAGGRLLGRVYCAGRKGLQSAEWQGCGDSRHVVWHPRGSAPGYHRRWFASPYSYDVIDGPRFGTFVERYPVYVGNERSEANAGAHVQYFIESGTCGGRFVRACL